MNHRLTVAALALCLAPTAFAQSVVLSEIRVDEPGFDLSEYVELAGVAGTSLNGLSVVVVGDGDAGSPNGVVESVIALSVVLAAANNLRPTVQGRRWIAAFGFGLIHGFGFASVLADLGLPRDALVLSLVGFNVGVELGQIAIVALFLPLAFRARDTAFYRRGVLVGGSLLTLALAGIWLVERVFDLRILTA